MGIAGLIGLMASTWPGIILLACGATVIICLILGILISTHVI